MPVLPSETFKPQLDSLRAFAVTAVLYSHLWDDDTFLGSTIGDIGVRLFFIISGFLITGILLDRRGEAEAAGMPTRSVLRPFYARRILRIFPAYYALLAVLLIFDVQDIRSDAGWFLTQSSNILFVLKGDFEPWVTAHYWSLAVEEQFYLVWPFIILFAPRRIFPAVFLATFAAAVIWRAVCDALGLGFVTMWIAPPASLDALAVGALLALGVRSRSAWLPGPWSGLAIALACIPGFVMPEALFGDQADKVTQILLSSVVLYPMAALVLVADRGSGGPLLTNPLVVRLGRISYGIYLYHLFGVALLWEAAERFGTPFYDNGPANFLMGAVTAVVIATASWVVLERPMLALKRFAPYGIPRPAAERALGTA